MGTEVALVDRPTDPSDLVGAGLAALGHHPFVVVREGPWVHLTCPDRELPDQGWKLHVSAHRGSVADVLAAVLPALAGARVAAKVVDGLDALDQLNDGAYGYRQVGKVVTAYPAGDDEAVVLAAALARATAGLRGPQVPFDRRLAPGSVVHYRYGSFSGRTVPSAFGGDRHVVAGPDGTDVPDDRARAVPDWVDDPFIAAGLASPERPPSPLVGGRYAAVRRLRRSARGTVSAGVDLHEVAPCILKRAAAWGVVDPTGADARDRLRHEARVLAHLAAAAVPVPSVVDLVDDGDDLVLVLGPGPGATLADLVTRRCLAGGGGDPRFARRVGAAVARAVQQVHDQGVVLGDLSAANVLVGADDRDPPQVVLIDLELARWSDRPTGPAVRGTTGYAAPAHLAGEPPDRLDDVFALGALLWYLATGRPPPDEPGLASLTTARLLAALADGGADPDLALLVASCLDRDPALRPPTAAAVAAELDAPASGPGGTGSSRPSAAGRFGGVVTAGARRVPAQVAVEVLRSNLRAVGVGPGSDLSVGGGSAGVLLAASSVAEVLPTPGLLDDVREAAEGLVARVRADGGGPVRVPGLFTGVAGVAVALVHPSVRTAEAVSTAVDLVARAAAAPHPSFDVMNGTAGVLRAVILVADAAEGSGRASVGGAGDLGELAAGLAGRLVDHAAANPTDARWRLPEGFGRAVGRACLGYGHGAAGIADVLLDWAACTGSATVAEVAADVLAPATVGGRVGAPFDPTAPDLVGGGPAPAVWCQGAGGLVAPLTRTGHDGATAALDAVAATRWTGPSRCHGLAGQIEILLDSGRGDQAQRLARLLADFAGSDGGGDSWGGPSLLGGHAGVAVALARMVQPEVIPWLSCVFGGRGTGPATFVRTRSGHDARHQSATGGVTHG